MHLRRVLVTALSLTLVCATIPAPASAGISTAQEIAYGKAQDKQITDGTNVVSDPLLNAWVNEISQRLWAQVARKDIPYNIKILDVADVNAFSTLGGYIYVNEGTLAFAQSDDELAGVIGHETGHIERRHVITTMNKATILSILMGVGSILSPILYQFGNFIGAGAVAKIERGNETEADRYGLRLMARAGYDPDAMATFMRHLGAVEAEHNGFLDKYLADHPGTDNRVAHLVGYPELDPKVRTDDQRIAAADHNLETARYAIAALDFQSLERRHVDDPGLAYHLGEAQIALGQNAKGEQNLDMAIAAGDQTTKTLAKTRINGLYDTEKRLNLLHPNLQPLRDAVTQTITSESAAAVAIESRRDSGKDQLKAMQLRVEDIATEIPDLTRVQAKPGSRLDAVLHNLATMSRSVNTAVDQASQTIGGVGSVQRNKSTGLLKENEDILIDLNAPLKLDAPPPQSLATFAYYPRMLANVTASDGDMIRAVDAARASLALLDVALGDLDMFVRQLPRMQLDTQNEARAGDYAMLVPLMAKASASLNRAAVAASQSSQLYMMARSRQVQTRIDMLGLAASPDRYSTLQHAIDVRFHNGPMAYDQMIQANLSPSEVTAAAIIAADTNVTPDVILQEAKTTNRSLVDVANGRGMHAEALAIFLNLIYFDYTDDPEKEDHLSRT